MPKRRSDTFPATCTPSAPFWMDTSNLANQRIRMRCKVSRAASGLHARAWGGGCGGCSGGVLCLLLAVGVEATWPAFVGRDMRSAVCPCVSGGIHPVTWACDCSLLARSASRPPCHLSAMASGPPLSTAIITDRRGVARGRLMYVHAYQSFIWNHMVGTRYVHTPRLPCLGAPRGSSRQGRSDPPGQRNFQRHSPVRPLILCEPGIPRRLLWRGSGRFVQIGCFCV